jgi:hypothetical protein
MMQMNQMNPYQNQMPFPQQNFNPNENKPK